MLITSVLLGLAICAVWIPDLKLSTGVRVPPWAPLLLIAVIAGLANGVLDWRGAAVVALLCALAAVSVNNDNTAVRRGLTIGAVALAFALAVQLMPGFEPSVFVEGVKLSPDAAPMRLSAHFAPGVAGLVLLAFYCRRARTLQEAAAAARPAIAIAVTTTIVVVGTAWAAGYVKPDWKMPGFTAAHLAKILLWTTVLEEAFFRGVIQDRLARASFIAARPGLAWLPIGISSVLFGLAHAPGGWAYVGLATLAGVGYGLAYAKTGLIEGAMATHFLVNATHFLAFTYPHIARG
jgi:membrane protease YdiL (CAAX protease family)